MGCEDGGGGGGFTLRTAGTERCCVLTFRTAMTHGVWKPGLLLFDMF